MLDRGGGKRASWDVVVVPFVFVPHGAPLPTERLARFSDPVRLPAKFVPRQARDQGQYRGFRRQPTREAPPTAAEGCNDHLAGDADLATRQERASSSTLIGAPIAPEDPIAAYVRINEFLDQFAPALLLTGGLKKFSSDPSGRSESNIQLIADNRRENKMVRDIVVALKLTPDQAEELHRDISGLDLDYHEIMAEAKSMFNK